MDSDAEELGHVRGAARKTAWGYQGLNLTPIYRVEYEKPEGQRQNALEFPAADAIEARKMASRALGIPFFTS